MIDGSTVLVTGGCGFIGVNLAAALRARDCRLVAFDNFSTASRSDGEAAGYEVVEGDIRDPESVAKAVAGADYVVHLAAHTNVIESVDDPATDIEVNVDGVLNVLLASRDAAVRGVVFASSNAPLGDIEPPSHEDRIPRPLSPYGASKLAGEALCSAFAGSYGLPATSLRFSNVYGPFSYHKGSVVATFMRRVLASEPLVIYGDGEQTRDFIYVSDLVDGVVRALERGGTGEVFHLGTGQETSVNRLVDVFRRAFSDRDLVVEHLPRRGGEIDRNYSDISRARRELGFDPQVSLEVGVAETRAWFERHSGP